MSSSLEKTSTSSNEDYADLQQQQQLQLRRGPWTLEEDSLLIHYITLHGEGRWNLLAKRAGLRRTGKSCRLRWLNYLKPDVKRGNLTAQEQFLILQLHSKWGNRWSRIAQHLPGRTDNEIKNYWRTRVQKQARHLKIDVNSAAFQNVIKCFWMPRLLQKIEGSSSVSSMASTDATLRQSYHHQPLQTFQHTLPGQVHIGDLSEAVVHNFDSSDSEHYGSSCVSSSESMNNNNNNQNISSVVSQFAEYQTSPNLSIIGNHGYACYDMGNISQLASTSALGDEFANPVSDCHVAENDWVADADGLWSMDELWELRNLD